MGNEMTEFVAEGKIVPITKYVFELFDKKFFEVTGLSKKSPYTRKKGAMSLANRISSFSEFDRSMLARHCMGDAPSAGGRTLHRYVNANLVRLGNQYKMLAVEAEKEYLALKNKFS